MQEKVRQLIGKEPSHSVDPDECVAIGAAIQACTLSGNALVPKGASQSLVLFDVTPMPLSIETVGGVSTPPIARNTTIPTRLSKTFYAMSPIQREAEIRVLQGTDLLQRTTS